MGTWPQNFALNGDQQRFGTLFFVFVSLFIFVYVFYGNGEFRHEWYARLDAEHLWAKAQMTCVENITFLLLFVLLLRFSSRPLFFFLVLFYFSLFARHFINAAFLNGMGSRAVAAMPRRCQRDEFRNSAIKWADRPGREKKTNRRKKPREINNFLKKIKSLESEMSHLVIIYICWAFIQFHSALWDFYRQEATEPNTHIHHYHARHTHTPRTKAGFLFASDRWVVIRLTVVSLESDANARVSCATGGWLSFCLCVCVCVCTAICDIEFRHSTAWHLCRLSYT